MRLALFDAGDVAADFDDGAGRLVAHDGGKLHARIAMVKDADIRAADGGRVDAKQCFIIADLGRGDVLQNEFVESF